MITILLLLALHAPEDSVLKARYIAVEGTDVEYGQGAIERNELLHHPLPKFAMADRRRTSLPLTCSRNSTTPSIRSTARSSSNARARRKSRRCDRGRSRCSGDKFTTKTQRAQRALCVLCVFVVENGFMRHTIASIAFILTTTIAAAQTYDVYAVRYATIPGFPVSGLIEGADSARKIDIAMMVWLMRGERA